MTVIIKPLTEAELAKIYSVPDPPDGPHAYAADYTRNLRGQEHERLMDLEVSERLMYRFNRTLHERMEIMEARMAELEEYIAELEAGS